MKVISSTIVFLVIALAGFANVRLAGIFGDNMVLQRSQPLPLWGWADPGERITVTFNKQTVRVRAAKNGTWKVTLKPEAAGGPFTLTVQGKNQLTVQNILVGEVWLCSGQSNMEWNMGWISDKRYEKEIRGANNDQIRHIKIKNTISDTPRADLSGGEQWKLANDSNNVREFSSVAYFFALDLYEKLKVPIGILNSSWGGTNVETWISRPAFDSLQELKDGVPMSYAELEKAKGVQNDPNRYPSLLYNGMINPLVPYAIKGALWYQGESNAGRAAQYKKSFPLMISDWRNRWNIGDFPFYFVQLASFSANWGNSEKGSTWAELREAQTQTLDISNTGMAVTMDIGNTTDIHPSNKKDVGRRLAAIALNNLYNIKGEYAGPTFKKMEVEGNKAYLEFTHADGLKTNNKYGYLMGFEVAGADQKFKYARAEITQDGKVVVHNDSINNPVAVRYAWADDMPEVGLFNKQGFPAVPFRTDKWTGITENEKYRVQ